jgi:hypothetical protein
MGKSSSKPSAPTTTNEIKNPWLPASQYLTNLNSSYDANTGQYVQKPLSIFYNPQTKAFEFSGNGPMGVYEQLSNFSNANKDFTPYQQGLNEQQKGLLTQRQGDLSNVFGGSYDLGKAIQGGQYSTNFAPVDNAQAGYSYAQPGQSSLVGARRSQGSVDPTRALSDLLSGHPDNPYLQSMHQANINDSLQGYRDAMLNLTQGVMPAIDSQAFSTGQMGGSRQGVAQGLATQGMERNARDLATQAMDSGNQLFGAAYENAHQGQQNSQFNASQGQQNSQFNANLGLSNAEQQMKQNAQNLQNILTGNQLATGSAGNLWTGQDSIYNQLMGLSNAPVDRQLEMLKLLLGAYTQGSSLGGTGQTQTTQPVYNNTLGQIGGLLAGAGGLMSAFSPVSSLFGGTRAASTPVLANSLNAGGW